MLCGFESLDEVVAKGARAGTSAEQLGLLMRRRVDFRHHPDSINRASTLNPHRVMVCYGE